MKWIITKDLLDGADTGYGNHRGELDELPHVFRLLDDDGIAYYEGRSDDNSSEDAFEPLDWAAAHAGCTEIQYRNGGRWETL
ncbi:hypothetical protein QCD60_30495 [Pokkaliibacter sp. MBI-7]|uniref:hypothetical protein n=1 Tax=Pokkaliibacter sp. MBI-7 TaxID=3040600 RepID=UPI00244D482D|nr:hypothetical protein [Pokkaliibacter sp. MBI-7]MDH2436847.1 hypothetical protein [Pokkaliibacter sp. MBI-7]